MLQAASDAALLAAARVMTVPMQVPNPLDGVSPGWGPFANLAPKARQILALIWMVALVWAAGTMLVGMMKVRRARAGGYGTLNEDANHDVQNGVLRLVLVALAPLLVGTILNWVG